MGTLDNFAESQGVGAGVDLGTAIAEQMFGIQNKGLFGRKVAKMYFTDLARPMYTFKPQTMTTDVKKRSLPDVEVYVDPQNIKVSKKIIANRKQTKGGWMLQFWGHDLTTISMSMKTGWFGFTKGQNLLTMMPDFVAGFLPTGTAISNIGGPGGGQISSGNGIYKDPLKIFEKIKNNVYNKRFDNSTPFIGFPLITLVYEGTPYTGFFNNFDYEITAEGPFNINFSFSFVVIPTSNKLLFEQAIQNVIQNTQNISVGDAALFATGLITNPNGTVQKIFQGATDLAIQVLETELDGITGNLGIEGFFDDIFPSKEDLN
ncbi:MAG: hypothetical protein PHS33_09130 [Candidatus Omnitrophica bacterium]|nr:hypothetical protein [Candidatus Omnitrophota bacterium]